MLVEGKIKYIKFSVLIVAVSAFFSWVILMQTSSGRRISPLISMSLQNTGSVLNMDPSRIRFVSEYEILANLHGRLLRFNNDGSIDVELAKGFSVKDNSVTFELSDAKTNLDREITAHDVYRSFKRLMSKDTNTHGKLRLYLDPKKEIRVVNDKKIVFNLAEGVKAKDFLSLLTSVDFSIIPLKSEDLGGQKITHSETFGMYSLDWIDPNDSSHFKMKVNRNHPLYSDEIPEFVEVIPSRNSDHSLSMFKSGVTSWIPRTDRISPIALLSFINEYKENINVDKTLPFYLIQIKYTRRGIKELARSRRIALGKKIKKFFIEKLKEYEDVTFADQVIPLGGEGRITPEDEKSLLKILSELKENDEVGQGVLIAAQPAFRDFIFEIKKDLLPELAIKEVENIPALPSDQGYEKNDPHLFIGGIDVLFDGTPPGISYFLNAEVFIPSENEPPSSWMRRYLLASDADRALMFRDLHWNTVRNFYVFPLFHMPFYTVVSKQFKTDFSKIAPSNGAWNIKLNK